MRNAMICISAMLALLQLWPMIFGQKSVVEVASPGAQAAIVVAVPRRVAAQPLSPFPASASKGGAPSNCFVRYRTTYASCAEGNAACGTAASDRWDLCEATGLWPD